ncbi:MAG: phosphoglycerate dehydrogenase [Chloroflexota bacterium]
MEYNFKVLVSDPLSDSGLIPLQKQGDIQIDIKTDLSDQELRECIGEYDALMVRSGTQVTAPIIQAGSQLKVIARAGVGVDNIDIDAATEGGIIVVNAPTGNTVAAAEHTVAMLMALARNIPQADAHVRRGQWKRGQFTGVEIRDKVLGSIGFGRVAQEVARRAQGLGMSVLATDPFVSAEYAEQRNVKMATLEEVIRGADFLTIHVPFNEQNRNLISTQQFAMMKPTARILNVARGGILDEEALVTAIDAGQIAGAALDVFAEEPIDSNSPLRQSSKIILTPHLGASTKEAQEQVAEDVAIQVVDVLNNRPARYAVNAPMIPSKDLDILMPYIDLAEKMGRFLCQLGAQGLHDFEITGHGRLADFDLAYVSAAAMRGLLCDVLQTRVNLVNVGLIAEQRGMNLIERKEANHTLRYDTLLTLRATYSETIEDEDGPGLRKEEKEWVVRGAILQDEAYIVAIDDVWVDFPAQGNLLVSRHNDRPGIIGKVGALLGESDVNISFMHVGRHKPRTKAIMVIGTDEQVSEERIDTLTTFEHIDWLKPVSL